MNPCGIKQFIRWYWQNDAFSWSKPVPGEVCIAERVTVFLALRSVTFYYEHANTVFVAFVPNGETAIVSQVDMNVGVPYAVAVAVKRHFRGTKSHWWFEWQEEPSAALRKGW